MELAGRKILPRIQPSVREEAEEDAATLPQQRHPLLLREGNGNTANGIGPKARERDVETPSSGVGDGGGGGTFAVWKPSMAEEIVQKRKRMHIEEEQHAQRVQRSQSQQQLPSLRQLLTSPERQSEKRERERERPGPARLLRTQDGWTVEQGAFYFVAKRPVDRDFPATILGDARELSFARVEPDLLDVFRHAWYLRHHIRPKRVQGDSWLDHVFFNDGYAIDNVLHTWTPRHDPGSPQYPASLLYKQCLWIFFNRSMQTSQPSPAYSQVVDDGLHFSRTLINTHDVRDGSIFLMPMFLLGSAAFRPNQRREIFDTLDQLDFRRERGSCIHAMRTLENLWAMMDDGKVAETWNWEKYQAYDVPVTVSDRALVDLLWDPLRHNPTSRVQSPENFDAARFRAGPPPPAPPLPKFPLPWRQNGGGRVNVHSPPRSRSPPRLPMSHPDTPESLRMTDHVMPPTSQADSMPVPRPFMAPPAPSGNMSPSNSDLIQSLQRKAAKTKSTVPPCPHCGKELKNPSDAAKHSLQHSKPFRCKEAGCTRMQGFATENDLQRHRKSVHGASPRIGNKTGYICAACPEPSDGSSRKWWPRLDNFKAHLRRKHAERDEEGIISRSASARRPDDAQIVLSSTTDSGYLSSSTLAYHPAGPSSTAFGPPQPHHQNPWHDSLDRPSAASSSSAPASYSAAFEPRPGGRGSGFASPPTHDEDADGAHGHGQGRGDRGSSEGAGGVAINGAVPTMPQQAGGGVASRERSREWETEGEGGSRERTAERSGGSAEAEMEDAPDLEAEGERR